MKKMFLIGCLAIVAMAASAQKDSWNDDAPEESELSQKYDYLDTYGFINVDSIMNAMNRSRMLRRLSPIPLRDAFLACDWKSNWFAGIGAGASAFYGNPEGCGDLSDRLSPGFSLYVGKWHTPMIGTRLMFQSGKFKDMMMEKHSYQAYHAVFLYNVTNHWLAEDQYMRNWT